MEEKKNPWEKVDWDPEHEQIMYRDYASHFTSIGKVEESLLYCDKSLKLDSKDYLVLLLRNLGKRALGYPEDALPDTRQAANEYKKRKGGESRDISREICDNIYGMNEFEKFKMESSDTARKLSGILAAPFQNRVDIADGNINDCIGESLLPFILENQKHFSHVMKLIRKVEDPRPLWKILKEQGKCDVLSILEKEEELLSPREVARRKLAFNLYTQLYLNKNWRDVLFLKHLRTNEVLLMNCIHSSKILDPYVKTRYKMFIKFLKMLYVRSPIYNESRNKFASKVSEIQHREDHLHRVQYQTRRTMIAALRKVQELRKLGNIFKLTAFVEELMGDYVVLKTSRVMPWKFEFLNEIYNTLALAHLDRFVVPPLSSNMSSQKILNRLLRIPVENNTDLATTFVFGDRSTHQGNPEVDRTTLKYQRLASRMEKRLQHSKFSIEKCYIYHEMARSQLNLSRYDIVCTAAKKSIEESKICKNLVWRFLSTMLMLKAHVVLFKIQAQKDTLMDALIVAKQLKSPELVSFVNVCLKATEDLERPEQRIGGKSKISTSNITLRSQASLASS